MKMADGGFRPAYNVQIASDTKSRMIVDIGVIQQGNDFGQAPPCMRAVHQRTGVRPKELLIDGGFAALATIEELETSGMKVYAPVMQCKNARVERGKKRPTASPAVARWGAAWRPSAHSGSTSNVARWRRRSTEICGDGEDSRPST